MSERPLERATSWPRCTRSEFMRGIRGISDADGAAIRQALGHTKLPQFVGSIDRRAPYRPDR